jgi:hypothetical protein
VAGRIRSTEKSNDLIGNQTRNVPGKTVIVIVTSLRISNLTLSLGFEDKTLHKSSTHLSSEIPRPLSLETFK